MTGGDTDPPPPLLRVVRGDPTDEELAALVTVLAVRAAVAARPTTAAGRPRNWSAYWRSLRRPPAIGPGAWRASALPR